MDESSLARLGDYGALGIIAAVAVWGAVKGIGALWTRLLRREEQLELACREFADRLEQRSDQLAALAKAESERAERLAGAMETFAESSGELIERLDALVESMERLYDRDRRLGSRPASFEGGASGPGLAAG